MERPTTSLRVGYLSALNYYSRRSFSGIVHAMHRALEDRPGLTVVDLGPAAERRSGVRRRLVRQLKLEAEEPDLTRPRARRRFGDLVAEQLEAMPVDVLFAPVASLELAAVATDLPVVYASDATFRLLDPSYRLGTEAAEHALREACEQAAIRRAARLLYSSRWAADSAIADYGADPAQVDLAPFGACFLHVPQAHEVPERRPSPNEVRLLFVGRDYGRKGGSLALRALAGLRAQGCAAQLTMVGCSPPAPAPGLTVIEYIDKDDPAQADQLRRLYEAAHFLVFPTRADCSPISLCEAAAFGLPTLATSLGGIPDIVDDGWGVLLPMEAEGEAYAERLLELVSDPQRYAAMTRAARAAYDARLNWEAWGASAEASLRRAAVGGAAVR